MKKITQTSINRENARINREKRNADKIIKAKAALALERERAKIINANSKRLIKINAARSQLKVDITAGIEILKELHKGKDINFNISDPDLIEQKNNEALTSYQLQKLGDLKSKGIDTISVSGGITARTLTSIGVGLGYTGSPLIVASKVLRDMAGKK